MQEPKHGGCLESADKAVRMQASSTDYSTSVHITPYWKSIEIISEVSSTVSC